MLQTKRSSSDRERSLPSRIHVLQTLNVTAPGLPVANGGFGHFCTADVITTTSLSPLAEILTENMAVHTIMHKVSW